jgi:dipeptidyl-peptidase-4
MKNIYLYLLAAILLLSAEVFPQEKLTIEDATGMNRNIYPSYLRNLDWRGDSDILTYMEGNAILVADARKGTTDTLFKLSDLKQWMEDAGLTVPERMPSISWENEETFHFTYENSVYRINTSANKASLLNSYPKEAENADLEENTGKIAYTVDNNLFISRDGKQVQVTYDKDKGIVNGQTVHRNEFGISKGTFWSPSGKYLAYYRKDETMVADYPIVNIDERMAANESIKYPMAGMTSEQVTLVVYNLSDGSRVTMNTGQPAEQYLTCVTWDPSEQYIYIALLNRDQDHLKLNKYDVTDGRLVKTLFEEKDDEYVEPENPLHFLPGEPGQFIWTSERDGYQHLYLYDTEGTLIRQLTRGNWVVTGYLGTNPEGTLAYFEATIKSPIDRSICSVELKNSNVSVLTPNGGTHNGMLSPGGEYLLDTWSDTTICREYVIIDNKGKEVQTLLSSEDPLMDYELGKTKIFTIKADDNTDLYCRMILPPDLDRSKKYPVLVYVYGGPHAQLITNSWLGGANYFLNYLAQEGFIVFTLDNRGSANRGLEFEQAIFRDLGNIEVEDQIAGVEYLRSLPYVDNDRFGVNGWSYGGFMTISLMLKKPDVFKAGACGGPVTDWKYYEVMYGERYMDTPESNPEGYQRSSLLDKTGNLEGDLLIIHGTSDPVVVWQHSQALLKAFISEGKLVDYFVYPGHGHGVGGKDRLHLNRKLVKFFEDHL